MQKICMRNMKVLVTAIINQHTLCPAQNQRGEVCLKIRRKCL
jgi:hypothetical protein